MKNTTPKITDYRLSLYFYEKKTIMKTQFRVGGREKLRTLPLSICLLEFLFVSCHRESLNHYVPYTVDQDGPPEVTDIFQIATWNVRGLSDTNKISEIRS